LSAPSAESPPESPRPHSVLPQLHRWSDAIGPLVLLRCLQPAFSLTILLLASLAYWGTFAIDRQVDRWLPANVVAAPDPASKWRPLMAASPDAFTRAATYSLTPGVLPAMGMPPRWLWNRMAKQLVMVVLWLVPLGLVLRQSVTACAERRTMGLGTSLRLIGSRAIALLSAVVIPLVAVWIAAAAYLLLGLVARWSPLLGDVGMLLCVPLLIAAGVLALGAIFAVPLSWASILTEHDCDTFDALSRGYEYTFRRPLHLVVYLVAAWLIHWVAFHLVQYVCVAGWNVAERLVSMTANGTDLPGITQTFVLQIPELFSVVMLWSLVGGIYLLLRRDANHQEVEDISEQLVEPLNAARPARADDSTSDPE